MKKIEILIPCGDIMQQIAKWSYTVGENIGDDAAKQRHFVQGATDAGHNDLLKAELDQAWVDMLDTVSAYLDTHECACGCSDDGCNCSTSNDITSEDNAVAGGDNTEVHDYKCTLYFPDGVYDGLAYRIVGCMRSYMVSKCRAEWCRLTRQDPSADEYKADRAKARLRVTISTRKNVGRVRQDWDVFMNF